MIDLQKRAEKLAELSAILCMIPCNEGENLISFSYMSPGLNYFTIRAMLNWKCDNTNHECKSIEEGIEVAKQLYRKVTGYEWDERE